MLIECHPIGDLENQVAESLSIGHISLYCSDKCPLFYLGVKRKIIMDTLDAFDKFGPRPVPPRQNTLTSTTTLNPTWTAIPCPYRSEDIKESNI